ncbi:MAG: glutamate--cysteine ligase [Polyangiaceae bacterium]|nr:glutamate--cysteine ligase [Polyangiaceae bacterium]
MRDPDELLEPFRAAEKPRDAWRIGAEVEKFGVDAATGAPLQYDGPRGVTRVFGALQALGWEPEAESPGGPILALRRGDASVTLEPGAQLELSGAPLPDVHAICAELASHMAELRAISAEMNLAWLGVGFHPLATQASLPWVPKQRYAIMREYLPPRGDGALDMMRRTATVQANFDWSSEADAMKKLRVCLALSPIVHAMTANAPFLEGRLAGTKSLRGDVWTRMDPARSGLVPPVLDARSPRYADYAEWALDAGMFLFKREGRVVANTGQTFRSFLADGFEGHRATMADWRLHLATLFPEARLKSTLEVRGCDSLPGALVCSVPAIFTGLLYDDRALDEAAALTEPLSVQALAAARDRLVREGLGCAIAGTSARALAERVLEIASGGLERRGRLRPDGQDERAHLARLSTLVAAGRSPADDLTEGLPAGLPIEPTELISRCRV